MVTNTTSPLPLPNPLTPLVFLPPALADEFQVKSYVYVASLGAFVWDRPMSMAEEYKILRQGRITLSKTVYFLSRISTLEFCVAMTVFQVAPVGNCQELMYIVGTFAILTPITNSLLYLFRVCAIYGYSKAITAFFGFWWLAVIGTNFLVPFGLHGSHMGPTDRCINMTIRPWLAAPIVTVAVNNTLVFLAISYRIVSQSIHGDNWRARATCFFRGNGVPRVARNLLHGGQLFYLVTILMGIAQIILFFHSNYKALLTIPGIALENAMACRVFRAVALGFITDGTQGATGPFIFTTVMSGVQDANDDMALAEFELDTKAELHPREDVPNISSSTQQIEKILDRV